MDKRLPKVPLWDILLKSQGGRNKKLATSPLPSLLITTLSDLSSHYVPISQFIVHVETCFSGFFFWQMTMGSAKKKPFCTSTYNQTKMSFLLCAKARVIARNQACHVTNQLKISSLNLRLWKVPTRNHFVLSQTKMSF